MAAHFVRTPLDDAQRRRAEEYFPLAVSIAMKWARRNRMDAGDLIGEAALRLCQASRRYRHGEISFAAFVRFEIESQMRRALRRRFDGNASLSLWSDLDATPDDDDGPRGVDLRDEFEATVGSRLDILSPRQREVIGRYLAGETWAEIAAKDGISPWSVEKLRRGAVDRLRAADITGSRSTPAPPG